MSKLEKEVAELIANEVSWFNGWRASDEMFDKSCRKAARSVIKHIKKLEAAQQNTKAGQTTYRGFCENHQVNYEIKLGCPACPPR